MNCPLSAKKEAFLPRPLQQEKERGAREEEVSAPRWTVRIKSELPVFGRLVKAQGPEAVDGDLTAGGKVESPVTQADEKGPRIAPGPLFV